MALRPLAVALLLALALAGCADKGTGTPPSPSSSHTPEPTGASQSPSAPPPSSSASASSSSASAGPAPLSGEVARDVMDNSFPDGTFTVKVGTKVTWTDKGSNPHSVSADGGAFDSNPNCSSATSVVPGNCLASGNTFSFTFGTAGSFPYHCRIHGSMKGTITVVA